MRLRATTTRRCPIRVRSVLRTPSVFLARLPSFDVVASRPTGSDVTHSIAHSVVSRRWHRACRTCDGRPVVPSVSDLRGVSALGSDSYQCRISSDRFSSCRSDLDKFRFDASESRTKAKMTENVSISRTEISVDPRQARVFEEQVCPKGMFYFTDPKSIPGMEGPPFGVDGIASVTLPSSYTISQITSKVHVHFCTFPVNEAFVLLATSSFPSSQGSTIESCPRL